MSNICFQLILNTMTHATPAPLTDLGYTFMMGYK